MNHVVSSMNFNRSQLFTIIILTSLIFTAQAFEISAIKDTSYVSVANRSVRDYNYAVKYALDNRLIINIANSNTVAKAIYYFSNPDGTTGASGISEYSLISLRRTESDWFPISSCHKCNYFYNLCSHTLEYTNSHIWTDNIPWDIVNQTLVNRFELTNLVREIHESGKFTGQWSKRKVAQLWGKQKYLVATYKMRLCYQSSCGNWQEPYIVKIPFSGGDHLTKRLSVGGSDLVCTSNA